MQTFTCSQSSLIAATEIGGVEITDCADYLSNQMAVGVEKDEVKYTVRIRTDT